MRNLLTLAFATFATANLSSVLPPPSLATTKSPPPTFRGGAAATPSPSNIDLALAGGIATMFGDFAMHPIDCIKTLQQSDAGKSLSMLAASKQIFKTQGISGFYSGVATYIFCDGAAGAMKFATYEMMKRWTNENVSEDKVPLALFGCAAAAFVASSFLLVPGELIKQRLQTGQYTSMMSGVSTILKNEGPLGLYAGYAAVCFRDIPYTMIELGLYDNLKTAYIWLKNRATGASKSDSTSYRISQQDEILIGAITGGIVGYITNPLDSIKTKLVTSNTYSGFVDCFTKTVKANGFSSLFAGGGARVSWLMPFTAIYLPVYDNLKRFLSARHVALASTAPLRGGALAPPANASVGNFVCKQMQTNDNRCMVA